MFDMIGTYNKRKVDLDRFDWGMISTAAVTDGDLPFETAVEHSDYVDKRGNRDCMVIVENYSTRTAALVGHLKWKERMTSVPLPVVLIDCNNSGLAPGGTADESYAPEEDE